MGTQEEAGLGLLPHLTRLCFQTDLKLARFNHTGDKNSQRQETPTPRLELGLSSSSKERPQAPSLLSRRTKTCMAPDGSLNQVLPTLSFILQGLFQHMVLQGDNVSR